MNLRPCVGQLSMIFTPLSLTGAYLIDLEKTGDNRGFFARAFCETEFSKEGLVAGSVR